MLGEVIRKYRREAGLTQEEMAKRLGVTTPAVNKWEKDKTMPDATLIAPIARLLGITTDTLLNFKKELTEEETEDFILELRQSRPRKPYAEAFAMAREKIREYPRNYDLLLSSFFALDPAHQPKPVENAEEYDREVEQWLLRCLESEDKDIWNCALESTIWWFIRHKQFERAMEYTELYPEKSGEKRRNQSYIYAQMGKREDAYRILEELLLDTGEEMQRVFCDLCMMYMKDNDAVMAEKTARAEGKIAAVMDRGKFSEISPMLNVLSWKEDKAEYNRLMRQMLECVDTLGEFTESPLYHHMTLRPVLPQPVEEVRESLKNWMERDENSKNGAENE